MMTRTDIHKKQSGMTLITIAIVIAVGGFLGLMAINIVPHFINDATVGTIVDNLKTSKEVKGATAQGIKAHIMKQLKINSITIVRAEHIKIRKSKEGPVVTIAYQPRGTLIGKVDYIIDFEHTTTIAK